MRALGLRLGLKGAGCGSYLVRLERGKLRNIRLATVVDYLKACNEPVGRFFLGLAQDGVFGMEESLTTNDTDGRLMITDYRLQIEDSRAKPPSPEEVEQERKARARMMKRMRKQARRARLAGLAQEVEAIVGPYLVGGHEFRLDAYVKVAGEMLQAGKKIMAKTWLPTRVEAMKAELDRIEGKQPSWFLQPEAVHLVRKMIESKVEDS